MGLNFEFVSAFAKDVIWNDKGSGANNDISFWRPLPNNGYFIVGDYAQSNYDAPNGQVLTVSESGPTGSRPALERPTGFELIWNDKGAGSDLDGAVWQPIAPNGYVALGCVATRGYNKPDIDNYRCVNIDLASVARFGGLIWNDKGSGADRDGSIYHVEPAPNSPDALPGDLFQAVKGYATPTEPVYVLKH